MTQRSHTCRDDLPRRVVRGADGTRLDANDKNDDAADDSNRQGQREAEDEAEG